MRIEHMIHARAGLLGNPSDGYFGKTISCLVKNFSASVIFEESDRIQLLPNPSSDPLSFENLADLRATYSASGYYGGLRLLQATCKRFAEVCAEKGVRLDAPGFTLRYQTDIPRQVGLAGSSAIVIATLRALFRWYGVEEHFSRETFPSLALAVEAEELHITCGLQDRVIQTYGGVMYMDFDQVLLESRGYGAYERLAPSSVPPLFLAYVLCPSDSGSFHSDVRRRWLEGDAKARQAMLTFAGFAQEGKAALARGDHRHIAELMGEAFRLRRALFGDAVLGPDNLRMVFLANQHGLQATDCRRPPVALAAPSSDYWGMRRRMPRLSIVWRLKVIAS
jgi:glucuronokinase